MTTQMQQAIEKLDKIKVLRSQGKSQKAIAEQLGLTQPIVSLVLSKSGGDPLVVQDIAEPTPPIHLVARNPQEMAEAQADLGTFFERKIASIASEVGELSGALHEAIQNGWKTGVLDSQHSRALARKLFYEKCLIATRAGYTIIPDIPIDVFAVRSSRSVPRRNERYQESSYQNVQACVPEESPQVLPPGEGDYKNPEQFVRSARGSFKNEKGADVFFHRQWAVEYDSIEFPVIAAVPYVMNVTQQAMALRVFDQIGISPQGSIRAADPLIIGQILGLRSGWKRKMVSFLIAWHLDLRTL
jgi:predicted transcriptional regulator